MRRIEAKDALFLYTDTPSTHMHMAFAGVFDPSTIPGGGEDPAVVYERIRDLYRRRLHLFPPFRWRLVEVPFNLHHPVFIEDPDFDIDYHLRRAALPAPGGRGQLETFVSDVISRKLDLSRPPWEAWVIEGVEDGRWAFVAKTHHVIVDGVGGNEALVNLLDLGPDESEIEPPDEPWEPEDVPTDLRMLLGAVTGIAKQPLQVVPAVRHTAETVREVVGELLSPGSLQKLRVIGPRTLLNGPIGPHRQVALGRISLDDVKDVKDEVGCTVNDVVVAICGRGLRSFLRDHGETYDGPLVAAQPISVRAPDDHQVGNQVAGMTLPVHDDVEDPRERLEQVRESAKPAKEQLGAISASLLTNWSEFAVPAVATQAFRFYSRSGLAGRHPPIANVTLSNVPGPDFPLYLGGSQMQSMYPLGPVIHGQRLNITVVSYLDTMFVGVVADDGSVPDVTRLRDHIEDALHELTRGVLGRPATVVG